MKSPVRIIAPTLLMLLVGCSTNTIQAPVIDRAPVTKKADVKGSKKTTHAAGEKDWRPDSYTVKKGDTLYGVGLEFGYDYKEIAQFNNILQPYVIRVGQQLKLPKAAESLASPAPVTVAEPAVVVTPLKTEPVTVAKATGEPPTLTEPKAIKEPYSEQAMAMAKAAEIAPKTPAPATKAVVAEKAAEKVTEKISEKAVEKPLGKAAEKIAEAARPEAPKTDTKAEATADKPAPASGDDESIEWAWPVTGKTLAGFNESTSTKGIDIAGIAGQPVQAAGPGKVVYSGSGLRGYGKLIIIKHNKTYLSAYAHNNQILVKEGQEVTKGQKIAEMGNTDSDRVKLHFEIRRLGKPVDPAKYLPPAS